jgi:hypothetical protein
MKMALRFDKNDEVDEEVKKNRRFGARISVFLYGLIIVFFAVLIGISDWLSGKSLKSYGQEVGVLLAVFFAAALAEWILSPLYEEFRLRTKEIDGKVSAIEDVVVRSKNQQAEELEKLISPLHDKLHFRTKELYLMVSAIEATVTASLEQQTELVETLERIEEMLGERLNTIEERLSIESSHSGFSPDGESV